MSKCSDTSLAGCYFKRLRNHLQGASTGDNRALGRALAKLCDFGLRGVIVVQFETQGLAAPRRDDALAFQGGGSHGAFTWGVLDRLLDDETIEIIGVTGISAGAMNGVVLTAWCAALSKLALNFDSTGRQSGPCQGSAAIFRTCPGNRPLIRLSKTFLLTSRP